MHDNLKWMMDLSEQSEDDDLHQEVERRPGVNLHPELSVQNEN